MPVACVLPCLACDWKFLAEVVLLSRALLVGFNVYILTARRLCTEQELLIGGHVCFLRFCVSGAGDRARQTLCLE